MPVFECSPAVVDLLVIAVVALTSSVVFIFKMFVNARTKHLQDLQEAIKQARAQFPGAS